MGVRLITFQGSTTGTSKKQRTTQVDHMAHHMLGSCTEKKKEKVEPKWLWSVLENGARNVLENGATLEGGAVFPLIIMSHVSGNSFTFYFSVAI